MTLAKAFVTGVVTKSPEKRFTQNDMAISDFNVNIDTNNSTILRIIAFGNLADNIASTISQGDKVAIEGKLQVNSYKLPNGKDKRIYEISASAVEKMDGASTSQNSNTIQAASNNNDSVVTFNDTTEDLIDEEEIPF